MKLSPQRAVLSNAVSPDAAISSFEAPDANTFVVKLAFPYAPIHMLIAAWRYIVVMPTESESGYDIRNDMRGSGAWRLKEYLKGSRYNYERNPDWYDADKVKLDGMNFAVLPETASAIGQFRAGNLWTSATGPASSLVPQEDVVSFKTDLPQMTMVAQESFSAGGTWIRFGYLPGSPFRDDRVRKAASMSLDRDLFIATFGNVDKFKKAGLDVPTRWNSPIYAGESFWLDPKDEKALGEGAKWYKFDPAEAKKLLFAAGINGPLETKWHYPVGFFAAPFDKKMEVLHAMWQDSGNFKLAADPITNYNANFQAQYTNGQDKWDGIAAATTARARRGRRAAARVREEQPDPLRPPRQRPAGRGARRPGGEAAHRDRREEARGHRAGHPEAGRLEDVLHDGAGPGAGLQPHVALAAELRPLPQQGRRLRGPGGQHLLLVRRDKRRA